MYPTRDLNELAGLKAAMRRRIAYRRAACARHAGRALRPLHWVDHALAQWRRLGPLTRFVAGPIGLWLVRALTRRHKLAGRMLRWGPMIWSVVRGFGQARAHRSAA